MRKGDNKNPTINWALFDTQVLEIEVKHPRLKALVCHLRNHLNKPLTLDRAAKIACLERTYFSKFFRATTGCSFSEWNRAYRIKRAIPLLCRRDRSVRSIALSVGYRDLTTFARAFKKCVGISPSNYRSAYYAGYRRFPARNEHR